MLTHYLTCPQPPSVAAIIDQEGMTTELTQYTRGNPDRVVVEGQEYNHQGRLILEPQGTSHSLEVLHYSTTDHLGAKKQLSKFREYHVANRDRRLVKEVM